MTKLFSMKSLACAGAAAFALTLAAVPAPQASAANTIDYGTGIITLDTLGNDTVVTKDKTTFLYYGVGNDAGSIKKYTALTLEGDSSGKVYLDVSNVLGKAKAIKITADAEGTKEVYSVTAPASPTVSLKFNNGAVEYTLSDSLTAANCLMSYKMGAYGSWQSITDSSKNEETITAAVKKAQTLGTTIYVRVAGKDTNGQTTPWSKEAKLKVSAAAKAPKISIKTAGLTKAFDWKIGNKSEYRIIVGTVKEGTATDWVTGKADKTTWETIFSDAKVSDADKVVNGDAVANEFTIQVRTAADTSKGKAASHVASQTFKASVASPTNTQVEVKAVTAKKGATSSAASITPKTVTIDDKTAVVQYSTDGTKWKNVTKETTLQYDKTDSGKIYLRYTASDKKELILPSAVTTVTIPSDGTKDKVTAKVLEISSNKWSSKDVNDWNGNS
jgi:hypothetical protein